MPAALKWEKVLSIDPEALNALEEDELDKVLDMLVLVIAHKP